MLAKAVLQVIKKALLVLIGLVFALAICEAGLRLVGIEYPQFFALDPVVGVKLRPGMKGYWLKEGGGYVSINSDGLRDREHSLEKPPNTLRIAVLGDSFAQAFEVNQEEAFWAIMEKDLQNCNNLGGKKVEAINFGIAGFSNTQELLVLRHRVWKYSPDVVLLAIYTNNDVAENYRPLATQWDDKGFLPYYFYQDGNLVLDDRPTKERVRREMEQSKGYYLSLWLRDHFKIYQLYQQFQRVIDGWWLQIRGQEKEAAGFGLSAVDAQRAVFREPKDAMWQEGWKITEGVLLMMRDEATARGAKFFVVVLSVDVQVHPDREVRDKYAESIGVKDLFYPDRRLEKFAQREGIPILLLAPTLQEYADAHKAYLHGFKSFLGKFGFGLQLGYGHWNQAGHRLAGEKVAQWLCEQKEMLQ
jgi:hypothetical protein